MVRAVRAVHLCSSLNIWIDMVILVEAQSDMEFERAGVITQEAYDRWFDCEGCSDIPIGDYISSMLDAAQIGHTIYYSM